MLTNTGRKTDSMRNFGSLSTITFDETDNSSSIITMGGSDGTTAGGTGSSWGAAFDFRTKGGSEISFKKRKGVSIQKMFKLVKGKTTPLEHRRLKARLARLEKLADELEKNGQFSFSEKAMAAWIVLMRESEIYATGFTTFIDEVLLKKFINKAGDKKKDVLITSLEDFERIIPKECANLIQKAKRNKIFDEIVIVHYDPHLESVSKKEKKKIQTARKDPIAFGKIDETNRLYFITDWEDEYCDLTFEDIQDGLKLEEDGITLSKDPRKNII